jgi:outer membrane lipoprotein-sorting protein
MIVVMTFAAARLASAQPLVNPVGDDGKGAAELTIDSSLDAVLDALNARGKDLKDFACDVALHDVDNRTGQDTAQIGRVIFQNKPNGDSRIRVTFEKKEIVDGAGKKVTQKQLLDYMLENGWLTDRDYQKKLEVKRQVLRPGQKMNLLKLGEGPFPLPIGQDKDEVKKQFDASKVATTADDPKGTVHVKLVPRPGSQFEKRFRQIDVFVDTKTNMPARIDTVERAGTTRSTELTNIKLNAGAKDADFTLPNIDNEGWNRREEPFQ